MKKRQKKSGKAGTVLAIMLGILAVVYIGISIYFTKHYLFNTFVNDLPAYNLTADDIEEEIAGGLRKYVLTIDARGGISQTLTSDDISLSLQVDGQFDKALKEQKPFLWPAYLFKETYLTTDDIVVYSREIAAEKISSLDIFSADNVIAPVDAHLSEDTDEEGFYIVPEEQGQTPVKEAVISEICAALDVLESQVILSDDCYEKPAITTENQELSELCNNLNVYCKASITYEFGDETVVVDGTVIKDWCSIDGQSVTFDEEQVKEFVKSLSRQYDTFGRDRTIISHSGEEVTVQGGDYGWWMDRTTEAGELLEAIKTGYRGTRTPVYFGTAKTYGVTDYGDSYVEIDLTSQHLWVYKDGQEVIDSDFVSGCVNKGRSTPRGTYGITYKERDATLVGENYSSAVKYWMPFNGNVGMHDASWRSEFGGWLYITDGSHGCINLPTDKAAEIFEIVEKGEAVFVYGGKTEPEAVVTAQIVDPDTGAVTTKRMPASIAAEQGYTIIPDPVPETPAEVPATEGAPVAEAAPAGDASAAEEPAQ
jgi:hypothetical protein